MVSKLVLDFVNQEDDVDEVKKNEASISYLTQWYKNQYTGQDQAPVAAKKRKISSESNPPLVVIVKDFENCAGPALQDLIVLLSQCSLPLVLVLGVATTLTTVHRALPQSVTARLTINTFGSPNSLAHLDLVVEKVIINSEIP